MNIGIDIDGVLTDIAEFQIKEGEKYFGREVSNENGFTVEEMFGCSGEEAYKFWKKNLLKYITTYKAREGASEFTKICHNNDDKIIIITSRVHTTEDSNLGKLMRYIVEEWLKYNHIEYDKIVYCDDDKTEAIKENNISIMLEDSIKNIDDIKTMTRVICFDNSYNRGISDESIKRIYRFDKEAYEKIDELKQEIMTNDVKKREQEYITVKYGKASIDRPWMKFYNIKDIKLQMPDMTVYEYLKKNSVDNIDRIAINYFNKKITYSELLAHIEKYALSFKKMGVSAGDTVSLCLPNVPEAIYMFYALNKIGAIANMIHPLKAANEIKTCINESNSKILVMIDNVYSEVNKIIDETIVENAIVVSAGDSMPLAMKLIYKAKFGTEVDYSVKTKYMKLDKFISQASDNLSDIVVGKGNDTAVIMYTGGTSGIPKGVELTNNNFNQMVYQQKATATHFGPGDTMLTIMPVFHGFGLCSSIHMPLSYGITTILIPQFDSKSFHKLIKKYKPNHIFGVPKLWKALMKDKKIQNMDLSFMRYIVSGGENMKDGLEEEINSFMRKHGCFYKVKKGYGLSEAVAGTTLSDDNCNEIGSVGIPLICNDFKVVKPGTEEELDYNEEGEFCISGPSVMKGYLNNQTETDKVLRKHSDGKVWLHTGDMGYITEDGLLYYTDRLTRMYVSAGFNIYPPRIEKVIEMNNDIESCAVVPMSHPYKDVKVPKVYVIMKAGKELTGDIKKSIIELCKTNLDTHHQPFKFEQISEFPITNMGDDIGKIDYKELEKMANEEVKVKKRV